MALSVILMDIEGTTTAIDFVHKVLFPYARAHMATFLKDQAQNPAVVACLDQVRATVLEERGDRISSEAACDQLITWIDEDRKHPALKKLQGMIWKAGYETGAYTAHLYDDVLPAWLRWLGQGKRLAIYSSGSVQAQKLLFAHTEHGDLTHHLSAYFDTSSGHKKEPGSYRNIQTELGVPSEQILFLSDVTEELDAAKAAGMVTVQLVRPGTLAGKDHPATSDFSTLEP